MKTNLVLTGAIALILGACASAPGPNLALENARIAVQSAEGDPNVSQYAALDLAAAKTQLQAAIDASNKHNLDEENQEAYLAAQTAKIAQARGAAKADEVRVANGQAERDRIQLAARTREVQHVAGQRDAAMGQRDIALAQRDEASQAAARATDEASRATDAAARAQAELDALKATPTARGLVLTLSDVLFDTGQSELKPGAGRRLDQIAQFLATHPQRQVEIEGFTDSIGTEAYNEALSQRRAEAVKMALVTRGADGSRIATQGFGKGFPVASNSESGGRQLNRRVEVVIGASDGAQIAPRS
jgi:outer membrane protein OmpA-like peptidoglycan-associated protein